MLQRHLDNRSIPVWSKVIPQSRGSHQQPAALSTFSRRRVVQLSGELVCSFKSVQCSTSSSKIGHLITMVAFQLHWLHFNCTSCISIALVAFQLHHLHFNCTGCISIALAALPRAHAFSRMESKGAGHEGCSVCRGLYSLLYCRGLYSLLFCRGLYFSLYWN